MIWIVEDVRRAAARIGAPAKNFLSVNGDEARERNQREDGEVDQFAENHHFQV